MLLYAVVVYDLKEEKLWELVRYEIIYRDIDKAIAYAHKKTFNTPPFRYYGIKRMTEAAVRENGLEDLIEF